MTLMTGLALGARQARNSAQGEFRARLGIDLEVVKAAGIVMLEIAVLGVRTPMRRNAGGVVRFEGIEVGRFSIMSVACEQRYQFNVGAMVHRLALAGGTAHVEAAMINRDGGGVPAGSVLVSNAHIVTR